MHWAFSDAWSQTPLNFGLSCKINPSPNEESTASSVYDPLGFLAPVILTGRQILQGLCRDKSDWEDPVPEPLCHSWERWRNSLQHLEKLKIQWSYKPHTFGKLMYHTTPPLFGRERPWKRPVFLLVSYRWHWSSPLQLRHGQGSSNSTETCYDPSTWIAGSPALRKDQHLVARGAWVRYPSINDAISVIKQKWTGRFMAKTDVKSAFLIIPIHIHDCSVGHERVLWWEVFCSSALKSLLWPATEGKQNPSCIAPRELQAKAEKKWDQTQRPRQSSPRSPCQKECIAK